MSSSEQSPIQNFYNNTGIFITGASGFLGTALLEKLIRSCPNIKKIYILMRSKRDKTIEQRLEEIFDENIWDKVKEQNPNYKSCVKLIDGNLMSLKLGISAENYTEIRNEVNVIFHVAATVKFDEPLKRAAKINIEATKNILELAKTCKNLKSVVHVSTAFSQCVLPTLKDIFYTPSRDPEEFLTYCEHYSEEELNEQTPSIIGKYPNTYTFTKSLAENIVKNYENELPIGLCRPSIVFGSVKEPIEGWSKGIFGPIGTILGVAMGIMHVMPCNMDTNIDVVPVDICVNQMIAVAYETSKHQKKVKIYNCVNGSDNPISWREYWHWCMSFGNAYAISQTLWYYFVITTSNKKLLKVYQLLFHIIPGYIIDAGLKLTGKEPKMIKIYDKIHKMTALLYFFCTTSWVFHSDNTRQLYESLEPKDQKLFPFDVREIVWDIYLLQILKYTRAASFKEPMSNVLHAQRRFSRLKMAHNSLIYVFVIFICWFLYFIFKLIM